MPDLRPLRGLRYAPADAAQVAAVLCPPYDVISPAERQRLAAGHPHNAVQIELPVVDPAATASDPYGQAARTLAEWIATGVVRRDEESLIYVYEQRYAEPDGELRVARSFFCRLGLEPYGPGAGVRAHEATLSAAKEDRFRLLSATRTNLSPVLLLYDDERGGSASSGLLDALTTDAPVIDTIGPGDVRQRMWLASPDRDPAAAELLGLAAAGPLTIADGHHRYETALRYCGQPGAPPGAGFVLALLYDAHSGGLALRPWHRVVSGVQDAHALLDASGRLFVAETVSDAGELVARVLDRPAAAEPGSLGVWTSAGGAVLRVDRDRLSQFVPGHGSEELRWLDVNALSVTLPVMIGITAQELAATERLAYVSDPWQAVGQVERDPGTVCFLVRPTPVEFVLGVAAQGEHMPAKSTYFHPKAATGLVFNPLD